MVLKCDPWVTLQELLGKLLGSLCAYFVSVSYLSLALLARSCFVQIFGHNRCFLTKLTI